MHRHICTYTPSSNNARMSKSTRPVSKSSIPANSNASEDFFSSVPARTCSVEPLTTDSNTASASCTWVASSVVFFVNTNPCSTSPTRTSSASSLQVHGQYCRLWRIYVHDGMDVAVDTGLPVHHDATRVCVYTSADQGAHWRMCGGLSIGILR